MIYKAMEEMDSLETFPSIHQVHTLVLKVYLETIHILRKHIFRIFGPPSPPSM